MANGVNGAKAHSVAVPTWLLWAIGIGVSSFAGWAIQDRVRVSEQLGDLSERMVRLEAQLFTAAEAARQRELIRAYVDARIRENHPSRDEEAP